MAIDDQELRQGLIEDVSGAKERLGQLGGPPGEALQYFEPKAIRLQGKVLGEKEMKNLNRTIDKVVNHLSFEATSLNKEERAKMERGLRQRFNQQKMAILKFANEAQMRMAKKKMDEKQRQAIISAISQVISGGMEAGVSNIGTGKTAVATGTATPAPTLTGYNYSQPSQDFFGLKGVE